MKTNTPALLAAFDSVVAEKVAPFFATLGAKHLLGESSFEKGPGPYPLERKRYEELEGVFFWWINRFVLGGVTVDLAYGDREFIIETRLFYASVQDRFAGWELLNAAQSTNPQILSGEACVLTPDSIKRVIETLARGLQHHWSILSAPSPEVIARARLLRNERMILAEEEQSRRDRERSIIRASAAFHAKQYAEAQRLLSPFRDDADLPPSSVKMLELSESKLKRQ